MDPSRQRQLLRRSSVTAAGWDDPCNKDRKICRDAVVVAAATGDATFSYIYGKVLHMSNVTQDATKDNLNEALETNGLIRRVKKMRNSAFVYFENSVYAV